MSASQGASEGQEVQGVTAIGDMTAWIALFAGLCALAAGAGELRAPGGWQAMISEAEASVTLRFLAGFVCICAGAAIYLANSWQSGDWLAIAMRALGGVIIAKGLLLLAAGERSISLARRFEKSTRALAGSSTLIGFARSPQRWRGFRRNCPWAGDIRLHSGKQEAAPWGSLCASLRVAKRRA